MADPPGVEPPAAAAPPLHVAVIGVGHLGKEHARVLAGLPGVRLSAVVDTDVARARAIAERHQCAWLADHRQLPDDVQAASVVVPTVMHFSVTSHLLERGLSVLVEKPMTRSLQDARALAQLARHSRGIMQVGHIERFNPVFDAIADFEILPRFIEAHRLAPFTFRSSDIGVVMDLMIHDLDLVLELVRSPVREIRASGGALMSAEEDMANVRLEFENGCVANLTASRVSLKKMRRMRIFATDSFISLDFDQKYGFIARKAKDFDQKKQQFMGMDPATLGPRAAEAFKDLIDIKELALDSGEPLRRELQAFVRAAREHSAPDVTADDGLRVIELASRIQDELGWNR
ncbi:MAG: Gfo/Idh/MocA family oxidoreductase [Planctomycetota bacterium]